MKNIFYLIKKNLKLLIRSKSSGLIIVLAPLMIVLLIGLTYNTSETELKIGIFAPSFTPDVDSFISFLQEDEYQIVKYSVSEDCIDDIKFGVVNTCLSLPDNFKIEDNSQKEIVFHIDQTKVNLVNSITDRLNEKFNLKSDEISKGLVTGMLTKISDAQTKINSKSTQVDEIKQKNQQVITQSETIKSEFSLLDLSVSDVNYSLSFNDFKSNIDSKISESLSSLNNVKSLVSSSELNSSDKDYVENKIDSAVASLTSISNSLSLESSENTSLGALSSEFSSMQSDLGTTKDKLVSASQKISSAGSQLTTMATSLTEGVNTLDSVKLTLEEIHSDLANQKVTDAETISSPISTNIQKVAIEKTYLNYLFPSLLVLVVMFISILLGTTLVMMEKHNQAFFRNFIVPVRKITFVFSTFLTNGFLVIIQIGIVLGISLFFLDNILKQLPLTALTLFISSSVFTLVGMAIGYAFTSEDTGTLASISTGSLFLFVSGLVLPLESMPAAVREIIKFNPFVIGEKVVREIFLFQSTFSAIAEDLLILIGYAVVLFMIILIVDHISSKHFLTRMVYKHHKHIKEKGTVSKPAEAKKAFRLFSFFRKKAKEN